jgi:hypothetical protein
MSFGHSPAIGNAQVTRREKNVISEKVADHQSHSCEESHSGQERWRTHLDRQHQRAEIEHEVRHGNYEAGDESRDESFDETGNESRDEGFDETGDQNGDESFDEGHDQAGNEIRLLKSSKNSGDQHLRKVTVV